MTTGQKIAMERKELNLTQEGLADRLGVSRQAVSRWEVDAAFPETEKLLALSKLFGCSIDYLLNNDIDKEVKVPSSSTASDNPPNIGKKKLSFGYKQYNNLFWGWGFLITILILYGIPLLTLTGVVPITISISANGYGILGSPSYAIGNVFFLFSFLCSIAVALISTAQFFFTNKQLYIARNILVLCSFVFYMVPLSLFYYNMIVSFGAVLLCLFLGISMILFWSLSSNNYESKTSENGRIVHSLDRRGYSLAFGLFFLLIYFSMFMYPGRNQYGDYGVTPATSFYRIFDKSNSLVIVLVSLSFFTTLISGILTILLYPFYRKKLILIRNIVLSIALLSIVSGVAISIVEHSFPGSGNVEIDIIESCSIFVLLTLVVYVWAAPFNRFEPREKKAKTNQE